MRDLRLLFFGDSLLAGVGDPTGLGWVGRVVARSYELGVPLTAYNLGVRGDTSLRIAARWRGELESRLLAEADTRVVLSFGVNDTTFQDGQSTVAADRSREALTTILDEAAMIGLPVLVVGAAPIDDPEQNRRIADLSRSFAEICMARGTPFVDVFERLLDSAVWVAQVAGGDGAHPAAEGYEVLARLVANGGLLQWLEV